MNPNGRLLRQSLFILIQYNDVLRAKRPGSIPGKVKIFLFAASRSALKPAQHPGH
jgi:hypothetical protein